MVAIEHRLSRESTERTAQTTSERLTIEFLYLDLSECDRCKGANQRLEEALSLMAPVLEASGFDTIVRKVHVQSERQATALGFVVSPTIRVNGRDIQLSWRQTPCHSCSKDCATEVSCREWEYRGRWYPVPPKELMIHAILREVYGHEEKAQAVPRPKQKATENLKTFFARKSCCAA
jgi:hypothetical protein